MASYVLDMDHGVFDLFVMTRIDIISLLKAHRSTLEARGVRHLALFGSRARALVQLHDRGKYGTGFQTSQSRAPARPDSDLDVLVEIDPNLPKFSLVDLASVSNLLGDITGIESTVIERKTLSKDPRFANRIAADIIEVF